MFTGGDSSGEGMNFNKFDQFRFAAAAAAATSQPAVASAAASIDWATLAAQWIQMRDNNAGELDALADGMPAAAAVPPSANLAGLQFFGNATAMTAAMASGAPVYGMSSIAPKIDPVAKEKFATEKGEADMDMDDDEETNFKAGQTPPVVPALNATLAAVAPAPMAGTTTPPPPTPSMQLNLSENVMQRRPEWYGGAGSAGAVSDSKAQLSNLPPTAVSPTNQWNTVWPASRQNAPPSTANPTAHIPSLLNLHVPNPNVGKASGAAPVDPNPTLTAIDAAKRKILPAWLREGLEKMEREKQKQLEQQQQQHKPTSPETTGDTVGDSRSPPRRETTPPEFMVKNAHLTASVEGENSGNDDDELESELTPPSKPSPADSHGAPVRAGPPKGRRTSGDESDSDAATDDPGRPPADAGKSYEQKLADLMIVVRRTLTELLLEVTNDEIAHIANETVKLRKSKASSAQVIPKTAFSAITNKLGLAAYADSSSGDDTSDDEEPADNDGTDDSEEELKATIRQKRRSFVKTAEEIEEYVSAAAVREEGKLKHYTDLEQRRGAAVDEPAAGGKLSESDFGKRGQRFDRLLSRKERTTRFSDNKDAKSMVAATATYISAQLHAPATTATTTTSAGGPLPGMSAKQAVSSAKATSKAEPTKGGGSSSRKSTISDEKVSSSSSNRSRGHRDDSSRTADAKQDAKSQKRSRRSSSKSSRSDDDYRRKPKKSRQRRSSSSSSSSTSSSSSSTESPARRTRRRSTTSSSSSTTSSHPSSKYSRTSSRRSHQDGRKRYGHPQPKEGRHRSSSYRSGKRSSRSISKNHDYDKKTRDHDKRDSSYEKYQAKRAHPPHHAASSSSSSAKHQTTKTHSSSSSSRRQDRSRSRSRSKTRSSHKSSYKRH